MNLTMMIDRPRPRMLAVMGALVLALAGCGSSGPSPAGSSSSDPVRVAYVGTKASRFQGAIFEGLSSTPGIEATFIESSYDVTAQAHAMQNAVASGKYKGIVVLPNSATGLIPAAKDAIAAGIQVVNVSSALGPDVTSTAAQLEGQAASVMVDNDQYGQKLATLALQACKDREISRCSIARIGGLAPFAVETMLTKGTTSTIAAAGASAELVQTVFAGGYDANSGLKAAQDLLVAHPGVDVIISADSLMKGIQQATAGTKVQLASVGGTKYAMAQVANGTYFGEVAFFPVYVGSAAGEVILKHIADPSLPGESPSPERPDVPVSYTKANVRRFAGEYEGG